MKANGLPGHRSTGAAATGREVAGGLPRPGRRPQAAAPSRKTCLLIISDAGLEIALRSAVELLADVTCETLSLNRLASLTRAEGQELDQLVLSPESFLIVDSRTEGLPSLQPLIRRLKGRVVCVSPSGNKRRDPGGGSFRIDPEAPLLEVVDSLRSWMDPSRTRVADNMNLGGWVEGMGVRETRILELLATGKRYVDIAETLGISVDTVRSHLRRLYPRLGVQSRTAAVSAYLRWRGRRHGTPRDWTPPFRAMSQVQRP
ncbi:MAG: response regulator transcription factor [Verrucomicrobiota bacterium]